MKLIVLRYLNDLNRLRVELYVLFMVKSLLLLD